MADPLETVAGPAPPEPWKGSVTDRYRWTLLIASLTLRAVFNPRLAVDLFTMVWAFRARMWYRRAPFLPLPPREYLAWRMYTVYADEHAVPPVEDVIRFARWRRRIMRR